MTDFERHPGAIDDPGGPGGQDVEPRRTPPGDSADNVGEAGEPEPAELDLPGPEDPVAWSYVEPGTDVIGPDGERIGSVEQMLGTENEGIFHGVAVTPDGGGAARFVSADQVLLLTPARVEVALDAEGLAAADEYRPPR